METRGLYVAETEIDENETQCHTPDDLKTSDLQDEQYSQEFDDTLHSQPFFNDEDTEETNNKDSVEYCRYIPMKRKNEEDWGSVSKENTEERRMKEKIEVDSECGMESKSGDKPNKGCVKCVFEKELDKRNYYFGNLLIGELQFVPPCMRSVAYLNILKYVDSLKQEHRK